MNIRDLTGGKEGRPVHTAAASPPPVIRLSRKRQSFDIWQSSGPQQPVNGLTLPFYFNVILKDIRLINTMLNFKLDIIL
jgi:hypothetical protein